MLNTIMEFVESEDGAVTVDWVVLTAGIVGLGLAVIAVVGSKATDQSNNLGSFIGNTQLTTTF